MKLSDSATRKIKHILENLEKNQHGCAHCMTASRQLRAFLNVHGRPMKDPPPARHVKECVYPSRKDQTCADEPRDYTHAIPLLTRYYASPRGRVWSWYAGQWLKPVMIGGRPFVTVMLEEYRPTRRSVAKLVLETHVGPGKRVGYRNGDVTDCRLENLFWRCDHAG